MDSDQQRKSRHPPAPPIRQGSSLSSTNDPPSNANNISVSTPNKNDASAISDQSQLRGFDEQTTCTDQVKVFEAIEGTPINFSTRTSFSDLTVDDVAPNEGRISQDPDDGLLEVHSHKNYHRQEDTDTTRYDF